MIKQGVALLIIFCSFIFPKDKTVYLGIDVLEMNGFEILKGKKVGLITNPTGVNSNLICTTDILHNSPEVELVALFGPEHGVRGNHDAGEYVKFYIDEQTNLPVYSLYGKTRKPSKEMLKGIDVLVFDIQDIGSRSYTYISTMGVAMQAALENDIEFIVLDRPNPLGGKRIEGNLVEDGFESFVSQFEIPYIHGMTVGELAIFLNEEHHIDPAKKCNLSVIAMKGWKREMRFEETGLEWIPTSPHIPEADSPFYYAATGIIGELLNISNGVGYTLPFKLIGDKNLNAEIIADEMNKLNLEGFLFRAISYKPYYAYGKGEELNGVQIHIIDYNKAELIPVQFYFVETVRKLNPDYNPFNKAEKRYKMFDKVNGTDRIRKEFTKNFRTESIIEILHEDVDMFREKSSEYYLYN